MRANGGRGPPVREKRIAARARTHQPVATHFPTVAAGQKRPGARESILGRFNGLGASIGRADQPAGPAVVMAKIFCGRRFRSYVGGGRRLALASMLAGTNSPEFPEGSAYVSNTPCWRISQQSAPVP